MRMYDIIEKKRDGGALTKEEIDFFIEQYTKGDIPDYQASALLMAVYFQNMNPEERAYLTIAMAKSGDQIDLSAIEGIKVDKHSTGGVGDTTTLVLAPLVASAGVAIAKMSGRGLGHTGGTIDKLEAIPGFHAEITNEKFHELVNKNKIAVIGQSGNLTPADKKLYSLRDVTATVNSIPLIASSIMSKKIASGADRIVLDVKTGDGAFMQELQDAKELATAMVSIGNEVGRQTMAIISDMSQPLGRAIGNGLEVKEAIETLKGNGPNDLTELCLTLGSQMMILGEKAKTMQEAREILTEKITNGSALQTFKTFVEAQGGNPNVVDDDSLLPQASYQVKLLAKQSGYISRMKANEIGTAAMLLGAGRATKDSVIDLSVGIVLHKKVGDKIKEGEPVLTMHSNTENIMDVKEKLYEAIEVSSEKPESHPLIYETITK